MIDDYPIDGPCLFHQLGYKRGAPSLAAEEIDTQVAESYSCPKCGNHCHYEGWHKEGSYLAFVVCDVCGYSVEF